MLPPRQERPEPGRGVNPPGVDTPASLRLRSRRRHSRSLETAVVRKYLSDLRAASTPRERPPP